MMDGGATILPEACPEAGYRSPLYGDAQMCELWSLAVMGLGPRSKYPEPLLLTLAGVVGKAELPTSAGCWAIMFLIELTMGGERCAEDCPDFCTRFECVENGTVSTASSDLIRRSEAFRCAAFSSSRAMLARVTADSRGAGRGMRRRWARFDWDVELSPKRACAPWS
jgi:hypothetical protein